MPAIKNYRVDLRGKYRKYFEISLILSLSLIIAAFKLAPKDGNMDENFNPPQELITIENIINTVQKPKPPPPPIAQPVIPEQNEVPEEIELGDVEIDLKAQIGPPPPPPDPPTIREEPIIFVAVEEMPKPIGGLKAIQEKVYYTEIGRRAGINGTVYIEAIIDEKGNVSNAIVKKGIGGGLDESALKAVNLTKFYPGKQRGKTVNVKMIIPIKFVLR
ncbi:MAG: energy transducer TonB [Ignavibacteriaceae bacterium]|jgi:protein TonB